MAYQFIHVESYSRTPPKKGKTGGHSVASVVNEATREPNSIPHIDDPKPPVYIYGKPLETLEKACEDWAASMTDAKGRKLRKDALCLVAGVVSMPEDTTQQAWESFRADAVGHLQQKYGDRLQTVIEHTDESHPHLHFYVVPRPGERFETIHQGKDAAAEAKRGGGLKGAQNQAYKSAMRDYQDEFFEAVGIKNGLTRIGPARRRLTREEWKLEQIQAEAAAKSIAVAQEAVQLSKVEATAIKQEAVNKAKEFAEKTIIKADKITKAAESKGFQQGFSKGLEAVERLPWWQKIRVYISKAVRERDQLRGELDTVKKDSEGWKSKAARYLGINKKLDTRLKEVEPKLKEASEELLVTRHKASRAALLREENEQLVVQLGNAEHRADRLKERVERLESTLDELTAAPQAVTQGRRQEHERELNR